MSALDNSQMINTLAHAVKALDNTTGSQPTQNNLLNVIRHLANQMVPAAKDAESPPKETPEQAQRRKVLDGVGMLRNALLSPDPNDVNKAIAALIRTGVLPKDGIFTVML